MTPSRPVIGQLSPTRALIGRWLEVAQVMSEPPLEHVFIPSQGNIPGLTLG